MIPKVIHRIWLGDSPLPLEFARRGDTWRRHHPEWEVRLWTDANLPELERREAFDRGRNHAERSDVLRYELLLRFGGVYADTDVECLRPFDELVEGLDGFAGRTPEGRVAGGVIGAVPGHLAVRAVLERVCQQVGTGSQVTATGPGAVTEALARFPDFRVMPPEAFYPYSWRERHRREEAFPDSYAVHRWTKMWSGPEAQRANIERLEARIERVQRATERSHRRRARAEGRLERLLPSRAPVAAAGPHGPRPQPAQPSADGGAAR